MNEALIALVGTVSALAGALLQTIIARSHAQSARRHELLIEAYGDFLTGIARLSAGTADVADAKSFVIGARQKMAAYAPKNTLHALSVFAATSERLIDPESRNALIHLVLAMRESVGFSSKGLEKAVEVILFGRGPN